MFVVHDETLGADTASFDVSSIPEGYGALLIVLQGRATKAATSAAIYMRMNNDSGANYHWEDVYGVHTTNASVGTPGDTSILIGQLAAASAPSSYSGSLQVKIPNYDGSTFFKSTLAQFGHSRGSAAGDQVLEHTGGIWLNTAAITRLTIFPITDNFKAGTRLIIYGLTGGDGGGGIGMYDAYAHVREEKSAGSDAGTFTSGAWRTRVLTTEVEDTDGIVSLASNQITLQAGTYLIKARAPAVAVDHHITRLRNITDSSDALFGSTGLSSSGGNDINDSLIAGRVTIAGTKTFELQHQCQTTKATVGLGSAFNMGQIEVYAEVEIWRERDDSLDLKISELSDGGDLEATDELVVARAGTSLKILGSAVAVQDPLIASFGDPDHAAEFDTSSFTGLTAIGSPTAEDADTTAPGYYYLRAGASGNVFGRFIPSLTAPFTVITRCWCPVRGNNMIHGALICEASPGKIEFASAGCTPSGGNGEEIILQINYSNPSTFAGASGVIYHNQPRGFIYFGIRVNSNTDVDYVFSYDGLTWQPITLARNPGFTVAGAGVGFNPPSAEHRLLADFIRVWDSALTLPGI